jgi:hypothetical protein
MIANSVTKTSSDTETVMEGSDFPCSTVFEIANLSDVTSRLDSLILAAGFEERAFDVLPHGQFKRDAHCILIRFRNELPGNRELFVKFLEEARKKFTNERIHVVDLRQKDAQRFEDDLAKLVLQLPRNTRQFGIDISGMPSYAICSALKILRDHRPEENQLVVYTAARDYNPTKAEYQTLVENNPDDIELLPKSMALEMDENLILDSFSGYRSQNARSCLAIFAGYEAHRSNGVVEAINPGLLLLLYGKPGDEGLAWRLELSKKLHRKFEKGRMTATEVVSTLYVQEALTVLDSYYGFLIDEYDLVISPISSKMNVVASYLFWEKYGEVQLTFPLPIGYNPDHRPRGVAKSYGIELYPRHGLFRASEMSSAHGIVQAEGRAPRIGDTIQSGVGAGARR